MTKPALLLLAAATAFAGEDPWAGVRDLKSGSELRIYKTNEKHALTATLDEVKPGSIVVVVKDTQVAIAKDAIDRIDARIDPGRRVSVGAGRNVGTKEEATLGRSKDSSLPPRSTAAGVKIGHGADFKTVYRRAAEPKK